MNTIVNDIDQLNDDIISNSTVSRDTSDLRDQRDQKLTQLSELVDIRYFYRSDGDVVVFTSNGSTLVDTVPPEITHTAASAVTPTTTHAEGDFSGFFIGNSSVPANDQTTSFREGRVKGLIDMRDSVLPDLQSQLDQLGATLRDTLNQVHNRGVAFPGAQEYNGTRIFTEVGNANHAARPNEQCRRCCDHPFRYIRQRKRKDDAQHDHDGCGLHIARCVAD